MALSKYPHINNLGEGVLDKDFYHYDKMFQCRWLFDCIKDVCCSIWIMVPYFTIDEMVVRYKGKYCQVRQYTLKKSEKWGLKIWCLVDATSKFVYNIAIYCGKSGVNVDAPVWAENEANLIEGVVLKILLGMEDKGSVVVLDNYFTSLDLFRKLLEKGIYATGTIQTDCFGFTI